MLILSQFPIVTEEICHAEMCTICRKVYFTSYKDTKSEYTITKITENVEFLWMIKIMVTDNTKVFEKLTLLLFSSPTEKFLIMCEWFSFKKRKKTTLKFSKTFSTYKWKKKKTWQSRDCQQKLCLNSLYEKKGLLYWIRGSE